MEQADILLVDDDLSLQRLYQLALRKVGFSIDCADTVADAAARLAVGSYRAAVIDYNLPDGKGLELLARAGPATRLVMVTGESVHQPAFAAARADSRVTFLEKPFSVPELVAAVGQAVSEPPAPPVAAAESAPELPPPSVAAQLADPLPPLGDILIDNLPLGVVVVDERGTVVRYNRYEERLARRRREDVIGKNFFSEVARCIDVPEIAGVFHRDIGRIPIWLDKEWTFPLPFHPRPRDVRLLLRSVESQGRTYGVLMVEDITVLKQLALEKAAATQILIHDLKTPLTSILGFADLLAEGGAGDMREAADQIQGSAQRMLRLVNSGLDELRHLKEQGEIVNLHALVLSGLASILLSARARNLTLSYEGLFDAPRFPERAVPLRGHPDKIASLLDNLLSNAVKYARSRIEVAIEVTGGRPTLTVADDGRGVPEELRDSVFSLDFQAPGSEQGHGVGLFSAQRIATLHGGNLTVSASELGGACFRVEFPAWL